MRYFDNRLTENHGLTLDDLHRNDWGRIVATLIGLLGDFDLAEEAAQEAFVAAAEQWPSAGTPEFPRAWIVQTARHKAIDRLRRRTRQQQLLGELAFTEAGRMAEPADAGAGEIPDDRLRLVFTCCHPAIALEAQVALTLRTLCGLETGEIARAFLVPETTMAQRMVRAKRKIREAGIPYRVPDTGEMPERLDAALKVIYLVFNEGYASTSRDALIRADLCAEAIRLARLLVALMVPKPPREVMGLLALMLLHDARRDARIDASGDLVLLEDQDRTRWNRGQIEEALPLVERALAGAGLPRRSEAKAGPFALQAAISALHCVADAPDRTDWRQIVRLYDELLRVEPSAVVRLNRAVALAMTEGPSPALALIDEIDAAGELDDYHLLHAARADLLRRAGREAEAARSYERALALAKNEAERRFLEKRLSQMGSR